MPHLASSIATVVVALDGCASTSASMNDRLMQPIDNYLSQFGVKNLPMLSVNYGMTALRGSATSLVNEHSPFLKMQPNVTWPAAESPGGASLMFVDLGPDTGTTKVQKKFFPFVHSLWTDCKPVGVSNAVGLDSCQTIRPYLPPGNLDVKPNRYTWVLFASVESNLSALQIVGGPALRFAGQVLSSKKIISTFSGFSFSRLLRENVGLKAVRYNFMLIRGTGKKPPAKKRLSKRVYAKH